MQFFENIPQKFGFGCMRLPMKDGKVDMPAFEAMVDAYMAAGFSYFDTARVYLGGQSETAIRDAVAKRYPRESFVLTDKLSGNLFHCKADIRPLFEKQLASCGVDYFDFYLMHAQNRDNFEFYKKCHAYEQAFALKAEGKIRHVGLSFHDSADVLDRILTAYPQIEAVQIQLNYVDFDDPAVQSRLCYEVCVKHGKPVIIMEPVKGGTLVNLPQKAETILTELHGGSPASYAIRFAAGFDHVFMVLSGMSDMAQMQDNLSYMRDFRPLDARETAAVGEVCRIFRETQMISCTACRYCTDGCPKKIAIPDFFALVNRERLREGDSEAEQYREICLTHGKASDCIGCGKCERSCPQHLPIRALLKSVAAKFES